MSFTLEGKERGRCKKRTRKNNKPSACKNDLGKTCLICLRTILSEQVKTKCKHYFHQTCLIDRCRGSNCEKKCPVCCSNIDEMCKKIIPFDSHEVFRYIDVEEDTPDVRAFRLQTLAKIVSNKNFDVNVKNKSGNSILHELSMKHAPNSSILIIIDDLLQDPRIKVSPQLVRSLIENDHKKVLQIYKRNDKIPKTMKDLV